MIGLYPLICVAVLLSIASHSVTESSDWVTACHEMCKCKWVSGLRQADCTNSSLTSIPRNLSDTVQVLDLSNNYIIELNQDAFKSVGLINLHKLFIRSCSIENVNKNAFRSLEILIELDLSDNKIHVLYPTTFRDSFRLRKIILNHNRIQTVQNGLFSNMSFLQMVQFKDCLISTIEPKAFYNVTKINKLELNGNNLVNIDSDVLNSMPSLMDLGITNNPWRCDCQLRPFKDLVCNTL